MKIATVALMLGLTACQDQATESSRQISVVDKRVNSLATRVEELEAAQNTASKPETAGPAYDLVVSWPNSTAPDHKPYADAASCETARAVILQANQAAIDEGQSRVGSVNSEGARVVAVGAPKLPTAICLPG